MCDHAARSKAGEERRHFSKTAQALQRHGLGTGVLWGIGIVAGVLSAIGPVIAGGALAAIAASAAGTVVAGGLVGALIGMGIPEEEVDVSKRTVGKEAVKVGKRTVTDKERVEGVHIGGVLLVGRLG